MIHKIRLWLWAGAGAELIYSTVGFVAPQITTISQKKELESPSNIKKY
jgi:hypothetical protein